MFRHRHIDFTQGSIVRSLILFSVPIVLGELLQNLYNSADALVVGNLVGDSALAAVSVCGTISNLLVQFFNGMSVGSNVVVSRAFGSGDGEALKRSIRVTFTFSALLGVALSVLGIALSPALLRLAGALPEYYAEALVYLRIYLAGLMFTVIYNIGAGILRAVGDTRSPFFILVTSSTANVILDVVFVAAFRMGIAGVGLATVLSQLFSVVCVSVAIDRSAQTRCFDLGETVRCGRPIILAALDVGLAAGLQSALISFSNIFVMRYINLFDTAAVAGVGVAIRMDRFMVLPAKSFGMTMTTYVSQNIGAQRYERVREGFRKCAVLAASVTLVLCVLVYVFAESCVGLFNRTEAVVSAGTAMLRVMAPLCWIMSLREVLLGVLRGYGYSRASMLLSLVGMVGVRQLYLALAMSRGADIRYVFRCYPVAWIATTLLLLCYYLRVRRNMPGLAPRAREG